MRIVVATLLAKLRMKLDQNTAPEFAPCITWGPERET